MKQIRVCPVRGCESLILPTRLFCHGHLMTLPDADRQALSGRHPGSEQIQASAIAYLNRLQPGRRAS